MALQKRDRELRFLRVSYLDFKHLEMDRVLTSFLARLWHQGYHSRIWRSFDLTVDEFYREFAEHPEWFAGFDHHEDAARRWIETHLMDMVNRGGPEQAIAAPRPLHGFTYRFRNPRHSRPYGADEHLYVLFERARGDDGLRVLEALKEFFFAGVDRASSRSESNAIIDVETQALLRLAEVKRIEDLKDDRRVRESVTPLCVGSADLLVDDVRRLLLYQRYIPRSVMVDYIKILLSFHLALYHLRLLKLLPALVRRKSAEPICAPSQCPMQPQDHDRPQGDCPYRVGLLVDVANQHGTPMARLAETSADVWYRRIPSFLKAYYSVRKLDDFAVFLSRQGRLARSARGSEVSELLPLMEGLLREEREPYFKSRVAAVVDTTDAGSEDLGPETQRILELGLPAFDTYIELLMLHRGDVHREGMVKCLDSLLLKHRPGALLTQPRVKDGARRFILDSRLLEVLLQLAVLRPGGRSQFHTEPLRIDALLAFLRARYGLYIDQLPPGDGFTTPSHDDRAALRANATAFTNRLREIGFYRDLSDAYVTQTVTPRYEVQP